MSAALQGVGVVVTRPAMAAAPLAAELESLGARIFLFPALAIEPPGSSTALDATIAALPGARLAIFVSANAVEQGLAAVRTRMPWPAGVAVAGIGDATAAALRNSGFTGVISPRERHDSEALAGLPELQQECVSGENVVIFRGEGGRERLKELLEARGAHVSYAECYRRKRPTADAGPLLQAWSRGEVHAVSTLSGETLENFVAMVEGDPRAALHRAILLVPHEAIAAHALAKRFARVMVTGTGTAGMVSALKHLKGSA